MNPSSQNSSQPADPWAETQPTSLPDTPVRQPAWAEPPRKSRKGCCCAISIPGIIFLLALLVYLIAPGRTNILLLGLDSREPGSNLGRSDTIILTTIVPSQPYVGMLSIPRDLWVDIPGYGVNRINTAHFFAEAEQPGSGPFSAIETVQSNFGVDVDYFVRLRFDGILDVIDALGGVDVEFSRPMSGYSAGLHHLNGEQALALVRDRAGSDDFTRMERGQLFLKALSRRILTPSAWAYIPETWGMIEEMVDTNIPAWLWPRLGIAILRVGADGWDGRVIDREMVNPFTTAGGAQVLGPNWEQINPVLLEMFGQ
ncbi:MAG: LCP family protein [Chloroflexota bacterium]